MAGGDRDGVNVSLLEPLVRKAELSRSEIQILIDLLLNKQQSSATGNSEWIEVSSVYFSLYLFVRRVIQQIVVIVQAYHFCQLHTEFYPTSCCQG